MFHTPLKILILLFLFKPAFAGVMLQGFYWDAPSPYDNPWWDQLAKESEDLSKSGFTSVWIPPVHKGASGGYSNGYDPYDDYDIGSKDQKSTYGTHWGTREQLTRAVAVMRANGLNVYFDNVLGHRSGDPGDSNFVYKDAYGNQTGGRFSKSVFDFAGYNDFGRQLDYSKEYVSRHLIDAGDWLINALGLQGMRIDMAKNVSPDFLKTYLNTGAMAGKFTVGEYWSENIQELEHYLYRTDYRLSVFDFPLWGNLKDMSNANGAYDLQRLKHASFASRYPNHSVTFIENHDTDRFYATQRNKHLGYAYILTTEGYPSVFWKDYFQYGLKKIIAPLIWIHEKFAHGPTEWRWSDPDFIIYERINQPGLIVGLNDNPHHSRQQWVQTQFGGFTTLHDYTGNAPDIRTEADGRVEIKVPANSYVAYSRAGFHWGNDLKTYKVTQQFAGATDLDIRPATSTLIKVGRIWVKKDTEIQWSTFHNYTDSVNSEDMIVVKLKDPNQKEIFEQKLNLSSRNSTDTVKAQNEGWYEFEIQLNSKTVTSIPYWINVTYQSPKSI